MQNPMSYFITPMEKTKPKERTPASGSSNFAGVAIFYVILPYSPFPYKDNPNP